MATQIGEAILELRTDDRLFSRSVDRAGQQAQRLGRSLDQAGAGAVTLGRGLTRAGTQAGNAGNRMALLRGRLGQVGFQVQDIAVQLAAGQSPFLVMAQQGSQVASAFGPVGIALGTVIALVGTATGVIFGLSRNTNELAGQLDKLKVSLDEQIRTIDEAIDHYRELSEVQRTLIRPQVVEGLRQQRTALDQLEQQLDDLVIEFINIHSATSGIVEAGGVDALAQLIHELQTGSSSPVEFASGIVALREELGITEGTFFDFTKEVLNLAKEMGELDSGIRESLNNLEALNQIETGDAQDKVDDLTGSVDDLHDSASDAASDLEKLNENARKFREEFARQQQFERLKFKPSLGPAPEPSPPKPSFGGDPPIPQFASELDRQNEQMKESADLMHAYAASISGTEGPLRGLIKLWDLSTRAQQDHAANLASSIAFADSAFQNLFGEHKAFAIASSIIDTAVAVTKALTLPFPLNFAMASLVGGLGAAQTALIAAESFQFGGKFGAGQPFIAGEYGKPELIMPEVGGRVFNAVDTKKMLAGGGSRINIERLEVAPGADPAAIAALEQTMRRLDASVESRSVTAVTGARQRNPNLFGRRS